MAVRSIESNRGQKAAGRKEIGARLASVAASGGELASKYSYFALKGETLQAYHVRQAKNFGQKDSSGFAISTPKAIVSTNGFDSFLSGLGENNSGWFLHELAHYAANYNDAKLAALLRVAPVKGYSDSDVLSNYFKRDCDPSLLKP